MRTRRKQYKTPQSTQQAVELTVRGTSQQTNQQNPSGKNESNDNKDLEELYTNIKSVPNYSAKIKTFLQQYPLHSVNKRIVKKIFPRRRIIARYKDELWQADLIEYTNNKLRYRNRGYKYILLVIDFFVELNVNGGNANFVIF